MKVLATKQLDNQTITYAQTKGQVVTCIPFIKASPIAFDLNTIESRQFDSVIFTSATAVNTFFSNPKAESFIENKKIFSLSGKTADALHALDIKPYHTSIDAGFLALVIIESKTTQSALHVCGNLALTTLQNKLQEEGINYTALVTYETVLLNETKLDEEFDAVMFFSPSGVESFLKNNHLRQNTMACCIGSTTATALKEKSPTTIIISSALPTPESMIDAIELYYKSNN